MRKRYVLLLAAFLFVTPDLFAQRVALGLKAGTLGAGAEVTTALTNRLNVRVGGSFFPYSVKGDYTEEEVNISYTADLSVQTLSALIDLHPFKNAFRLSVGAVYNGTAVDATARPTESYTVKQRTFSKEELGTLSGTVDYGSKIAPYAGIGFGNAVRGSRLDVTLDLGVIYTNSPSLDLKGTGMIAPTAEQDQELEDELSGIKLYPVISLGLSYGF